MSGLRLKERQGFTLLEILVVIALLGVVSTWGYVIMFRVDSEWRELRQRTELSNTAELIFAEMRRDVEAMISPKLTGIPLVGTARTHTDSRRLHELFDDALILPITATTADGSPQSQRVRYYVERSQERDQMVRGVLAGPPDSVASVGNALATKADVVKLRFEFAAAGAGDGDGYEWVTGWSRPELPDAVRVSLALADRDNPSVQVSRKAVFDVRIE